MGHHEKRWLENYNSGIEFYRRYVDDTFALFNTEQDAVIFLYYYYYYCHGTWPDICLLSVKCSENGNILQLFLRLFRFETLRLVSSYNLRDDPFCFTPPSASELDPEPAFQR